MKDVATNVGTPTTNTAKDSPDTNQDSPTTNATDNTDPYVVQAQSNASNIPRERLEEMAISDGFNPDEEDNWHLTDEELADLWNKRFDEANLNDQGSHAKNKETVDWTGEPINKTNDSDSDEDSN